MRLRLRILTADTATYVYIEDDVKKELIGGGSGGGRKRGDRPLFAMRGEVLEIVTCQGLTDRQCQTANLLSRRTVYEDHEPHATPVANTDRNPQYYATSARGNWSYSHIRLGGCSARRSVSIPSPRLSLFCRNDTVTFHRRTRQRRTSRDICDNWRLGQLSAIHGPSLHGFKRSGTMTSNGLDRLPAHVFSAS